jgi:hypothetical protein
VAVVGVVAVGVDDVVELPPVAPLANAAPPPASAPMTISAAIILVSLVRIGLLCRVASTFPRVFYRSV